MKWKRTLAFITISLFAGSTWITQSQFPDPFAHLPSLAFNSALSALMLGAVALCLRVQLPAKKEWIVSAILGIMFYALPYLLTFWVSKHLPSGASVILFAATPLVAGFLCDAPWSAKSFAIAGLGGVSLVVGGTVSALSWNQLPWILVLLVSVGGSTASLVFAKEHLTKCHPIYTAAIGQATAAVILGLVNLANGKPTLPHASWITIALLVAASAAASALYFWLLKQVRVDQLTSIVWAQILIAVAESIFLLRPHLDWQILLGAIVIVGSILAIYSPQSDEPVLTVGVT